MEGVNETLARVTRKFPNTKYITLNENFDVVQSNMKTEMALSLAESCNAYIGDTRRFLQNWSAASSEENGVNDDFRFLRLTTKMHDIMIIPDSKYFLIVTFDNA